MPARDAASLTLDSSGTSDPRPYTLSTTAAASAPPVVSKGIFAQDACGRLGEVIAQENEIWVRLRWVRLHWERLH